MLGLLAGWANLVMNGKYIAFDIETAKILPKDVEDLLAHRPLGICCAATLAADQSAPRLFYSKKSQAIV